MTAKITQFLWHASALTLIAGLCLIGCASSNPSERVMYRYKVLPWQIPNPEITKGPLDNRTLGDSMRNDITFTKYDGSTLCLSALVASAPRQLVESSKDLFRLAVANDFDQLVQADPPPFTPASVTVKETITSVFGEGTRSEVCFQGSPTILTPQTQFIRLLIGATPKRQSGTIVWELNDPTKREERKLRSGEVVRTRSF